MKNNFRIQSKEFEVNGVKIPEFEIHIKSEYTVEEVRAVKQIMKEFLKELPEMIEDIKTVTDKLDELTNIPSKAETKEETIFENVEVKKTEENSKEAVPQQQTILTKHGKRLLGK